MTYAFNPDDFLVKPEAVLSKGKRSFEDYTSSISSNVNDSDYERDYEPEMKR